MYSKVRLWRNLTHISDLIEEDDCRFGSTGDVKAMFLQDSHASQAGDCCCIFSRTFRFKQEDIFNTSEHGVQENQLVPTL